MLPKFSLRAHKAALTCIITHQDKLISSDRDGWIIVWNLASRRPMALWRGHDGHILTLKSTSMGLISHGRDSMIRIWNLSPDGLEKCSRNGSDISSVGVEATQELPQPPHADIPVNALNFCNVDFFDGLLITPATIDSDNFDVYKISDPFGAFNFERVLQNISPLGLSKSDDLVEEIGGTTDADKRGGHGIIMRILFVRRDVFFVGYESGAIYGLRLEHTNHDKSSGNERVILFKGYRLTIVFFSMDHKPSPILSLNFDRATSELYTGSASKKLLIYDLKNLIDKDSCQCEDDGTVNHSSHNLRHYGIQCVQITDGMVLTGFWDGTIKGYTKDFKEVARLERKEESIKPVGDEELSKPAKKSVCMDFWIPHTKTASPPTSRKLMLRKAAVGHDPLLFVGYGDGLITAFQGIY
ncbi:hypothetical protein JCM33374_g5626 [Metschnikowia sp. JCM 33374]|nr:hypothetical protein JCM33374_g5626 [Metschnikowia sp. JCM 33374]